jgi:PAS domain S-box-containing protein
LWCFAESGTWRRRVGRALAVGCAVVGALTFLEYATATDFGIDQLIVLDPWARVFPGRMALLTAANLFTLGIAIVAIPAPNSWPSQTGAAAVATTAFVTLISYAYDSATIFRFVPYAFIAPHTAGTLGVLAAGVFAARPHDGLARLLSASTPGGRLARRFIPFVIFMPPLVGWLQLAGERAGWYDRPVGVSVFAITVTLTLIWLTLRSASWIDRSERQQREAEQHLELARRQAMARATDLAAVVDASDDAIIATSCDGTITTWNPGAERLYGYGAADAIGQQVRLIIPRERFDEGEMIMRKVQAGESTMHLQTVRQTKTGNLVDVSLTVSPIKSPEGTITGASAIARDITELRQVSERFRLAFEAASSGMMLVDRQGRIVLVNTEVERIFGYLRWELVGRTVDVLVPDAQREGHPELRDGFLTSAEGRRMGVGRDVRGRRKDGSEFPAEINLNPLITRDGLLILSVILDVSDRQAMLQRLEAQRAELQRSNDELMQFAYVASHDLQEPLRMVASYTELLESRYQGQLDQRADKYIRYISEGATRMQRLIRDLLAYARVGTRAQAKTSVDLNQVAQRVVGDLRQLVSDANAEIVVSPLPTIKADETQMGQLLQNLIGNAIKFRSARPPRIVVSAARDQGAWCLTVEDNGIGIDPQFHDRVFEIFQRLHDRQAYDGSGVGLAVVKRIAERHGGRVWFESTPGVGSRFHVTLAQS